MAVSNALLKTLEEPQGKTVFILVSDTARVLPTIMSRCTVLRCNRLSLEELREFARNRNLRITDELLSAANGSPHTLTALVNKDASAVAIATQVEQVHEALAQGTAQRLLLAISLAELDTDMIKHILEQWTMRITKTLATHPQRHTAITVAQETLQRLRANANKKMALEYFVLNSQL